MSSLVLSPILAVQSSWPASIAVICIGILWIGALVRSQKTKGEGAH